MKHIALALAARTADPNEKLNFLREYLQAFCLRSLHESGAFSCLSFVGGTALRFLYELPRFSEDLDFSLETMVGYSPESWLEKLKRDLVFAGFEAELSWNAEKVVQAAWVRVSGLMAEAGIAPRPAQKLAIKLEIDSLPSSGAKTEIRLLNRHFLFAVRHHALPCLMAGKIRALLTWPFTKGRDWYDLVWYLSQVPPIEPAPDFLLASLAQGDKSSEFLTSDWRRALRAKLETVDERALAHDVLPFLERPVEKTLLMKAHIRSLLRVLHLK